MFPAKVSIVSLDPELIDAIVFWTKDAEPCLDKLDRLSNYMYYFQYTVNAYDNEIEKNVPKQEDRMASFIKLSKKIGRDRVIWRYDPILFTAKIDADFHIDHFERMAEVLGKHTNRVIISIVDYYRKISTNMKALAYRAPEADEIIKLAKAFKAIAERCGLEIFSCAEDIDLTPFGIMPGKCIDDELISRLLNKSIKIKKDKSQREVCHCTESIDIGAYNTCLHGCKYCYANFSESVVNSNQERHNPKSLFLVGDIEQGDIMTQRKMIRYRQDGPEQIRWF